MREYLSSTNLGRAAALGTVLTVMSVPRLAHAGVPLGFYIPAAFFILILLSGAVTAWGDKGGMVGAFPRGWRPWIGVAIALLVGVLSIPLSLRIDSVLRRLLLEAGQEGVLTRQRPGDLAGMVSLVLWSASFQVVFFQMSAMSLLARLTGNQFLALVGVVILSMIFSSYHLHTVGVTSGGTALVLSAGFSASLGCLLFARAGVPACMVLAAASDLHLCFQAG